VGTPGDPLISDKKTPEPGLTPSSSIIETGTGTSIRLTKPQRALLAVIEDTPEPERFDLVAQADPTVVGSLVEKGLIQLRTIPRSHPRGDSITHEEARLAVLAAMRQHPRSKGTAVE
jgi:hypothetical protein